MEQTITHRVREGRNTAWLLPAVLFTLTGVVNIGIAITSSTVWPAVLAAALLIAAAACVRGAIAEQG
ncbi:hypothetical protein [Umezawaea sp. Da 62-37]|uniref:hypothetical protein n=1 Tax=Umezawaea sp. Da 62-37 TaxID=3075927 RepID=UPI0028F7473E|nr:hypothetical protein [Umezawaea sp. Da 62-37]WNV88622.1 hypothetical protein RM788_10085 [Umezawaea sp. Da 62-37]